jgi:hypothetical protein
MSNYPDGMTMADWAVLDGGPECRDCGAEQSRDDIETSTCWNCGEFSGHGVDEGRDPDDARDAQMERDMERDYENAQNGGH